MKAVWNDTVLAKSDETVVVEGKPYFPPDSVNWEALATSSMTSRCFWKGKADYFGVHAGGQTNRDAAWTYEKPWPLARKIAGYVAFWRGVRIEE